MVNLYTQSLQRYTALSSVDETGKEEKDQGARPTGKLLAITYFRMQKKAILNYSATTVLDR